MNYGPEQWQQLLILRNQNILDGTTQVMCHDEEHLLKIFAVCKLTPSVKHWMPTREAWVKAFLSLKPDNLVIRFSAPMVNTSAPSSWPATSTVVTTGSTCPAPKQGNECRDCRACWDPEVKNVAYGQH